MAAETRSPCGRLRTPRTCRSRYTGKDGCVAEVLKVSLAVLTIPIDPPDPGNPNTRASRELARSFLHDVADNLMARNDSFTLG